MRKIRADVLIVGSGGAALRAAIAAKTEYPGGKILVAAKGRIKTSGVTANACSDRMAFQVTMPYSPPAPEENLKYHAADIYKIGGFVSDKNLADVLARESADAYNFLDQLGVPFAKDKEGKLLQFLTDCSTYPRAAYTGPYTGVHIHQALQKELASMDIDVLENTMVFQIITDNSNNVIGAAAIEQKKGPLSPNDIVQISTNNVILATGGAGALFEHHVFTKEMVGDGYSMAYEGGAELVNLEFIQIMLCSRKTNLACSGSIMRSIPTFENQNGNEFLLDYFPPGTTYEKLYNTVYLKGFAFPVSSEHLSSFIDIAVYKELLKGNKVFLNFSQDPTGFDFRNLNQELIEHYNSEKSQDVNALIDSNPLNRLKELNPASIQWFKDRFLDIEKEGKIEVIPAVQHFQGGIKIDENGQTRLAGLFAAGEAAGGQHGANRPGGNALLDCQVFGKICGTNAARRSQNTVSNESTLEATIQQVQQRLNNLLFEKGQKAQDVRKQIQHLMYRAAGVVRTAERIEEGLRQLSQLKEESITVDEHGLYYALETQNMFSIAEMVLRACMMRRESRGPHLYFTDFDSLEKAPRTNDWNQYIVIAKENGNMKLDARVPREG